MMTGILIAIAYVLMGILSGTILLAYTKIKKWGPYDSWEILVGFGGMFWPAFWLGLPVYLGISKFVTVVSNKIVERWGA